MSKRFTALCAAFVPALAIAACGSSSSSTSSSTSGSATGSAASAAGLHLTISEAGKEAKLSGPATTAGGVVAVTLQNTGKSPHNLQFAQVVGDHTVAEAYKQIQGNSTKTPGWLRAAGGVSTTMPGQSNSATVDLSAGKYLVTETPGPGATLAPAQTSLTVTPGTGATALPSTPATVTAATAGTDKYRWKLSGLHVGPNRLTFKSEGAQALHVLIAIAIKPGQNPSLAEIEKSFASNGPPSFADLPTYRTTAVLDGGRSQVTTVDLKRGTYVFFCPLTDRDGGKPHFAEGLLTKYTVN